MEKYKEFILPYNIIFINKQSPYIIQHIKADLLHYQGGDKIANCITRDPYDIYFFIGAMEGKDVDNANISGSFIQNNMEGMV